MSRGDGIAEELQKLIGDIERLLGSTLGDVRGEARAGGTELQEALAALLSRAGDLKEALVQKIEKTDRRVHDNPWTSVGISALVAFIAGMIVGHQQHQRPPG
jgi:ElaB/YqjD/DUF883 family membrane-anchored ribosome-binding protein